MTWRIVFLAVLSTSVFGFLPIVTDAEEPKQNFFVSKPVKPGLSLPVRQIPPDFGPEKDQQIGNRLNPLINEPDQGKRGTWDQINVPLDPLAHGSVNGAFTRPPDFTFDGTSNPTGCGSCTPPDTVGDAGPNHYIQMVNATKVAIYDKSGILVSGPFNLGTLWSSGTCTSNAGDPIVLYDGIADRWLLSQFADPSHMCVAISQTADPTGSYFTYTFDVGDFPDYFKFGVWPDGYYMAANEFSLGYTAYAFDRAQMLIGAPATFQKFTGGTNFYLPSDLDGSPLPPAGAPNYFYTFKDNSFHGGLDRIEVREFHVDWIVPVNSTFTLTNTFNITSYTYTVCGFFNFDCIRQLDTGQRFDAVSEWPMHRFPYRNFGSHQTLLGNFAVGGGLGEEGSAIRWFELRNTGSGWTLFQEATYDPGDGHDRCMGSIAMDGNGNIALGYTVSSSTMHPAIRYATRLASDPPGTLGTEQVIINPAGSQTGSNRWGDYSAMSVDPADDCHFWYTNEYYNVNSTNQWKTRVGVFTAAPCVALPDVTIAKSDNGVTAVPGGNITYVLTYGNIGSADANSVEIEDIVPANTTFNPGASTPGWVCVPDNTSGSTCTFTIGTLPAGSTGNITNFVVTVDNPLGAGVNQIDNTATISDDGSDPNPGNNSSSDSTPINAAPDLQITKDDGGISSTPGGSIVYSLIVTNVASQNASGVQITDAVPANTMFDPANSTPGWSCVPDNDAGSVCTFVVGNLAGNGGNITVNYAVIVDPPPLPGATQIDNTASVADDGTGGPDPTPSDNTDSDSTALTTTCIFCDDFEDGVLSTMWTYEKLDWSESGGDLIGTPVKRKAVAIATPVFGGCSMCSVSAGLSTAGGEFSKVWLFGWRVDKDNTVEVLMKEENDKWVLRQRVNRTIVAKDSGFATIDPNVNYDVQVSFDGTTFTLTVDGTVTGTIIAVGSPSGTVGFAAKNTTGFFEFISVN